MLDSREQINTKESSTYSPVGTSRGKPNKENINYGYVFLHATIITIGMFQFGVLIGQWNAMSQVYGYLKEWDSDQSKWQGIYVTTAQSASAMIGSYLAPYLENWKSKRVLIILCNVPLVIGFGLEAATEMMPLLLTGKFIQGLSAGALSVFCPAYLVEMTPVELKNPLGAMNQFMVTFGIAFVALLGLPIPGAIASD